MSGEEHSEVHGRRRGLIAGLAATAALGLLSATMLWTSLRQSRANQDLQDGSKLLAAQGQLTSMSLQLARYVREHRELPDRLEQAFSSGELLDPWGTRIRYEIVQFQTGEIRLTSAGPDRMFGTTDDVLFESRRR